MLAVAVVALLGGIGCIAAAKVPAAQRPRHHPLPKQPLLW